MTETARSADGTTIAFDRSGEGPALVVVSGALGDRVSAGKLAEHLASSFTVFAYDRRGRGDSGDTTPYAVEREIEDLDALIGVAGGSAFVHGHSSGSVLSLRAAAAELAIPKLTMYEPPFIVDDSRPPQPDDYLPHLDELIAAGRRGDAVEYFFLASVGLPPEPIDGMRQDPNWARMEALAHTLRYDGRVMADTMRGDPAPLQQFATMAVPTVVIDGDGSYRFMRASADAIAAVLPNATRRSLAGQTHAADPAALAPVLIEAFLG